MILAPALFKLTTEMTAQAALGGINQENARRFIEHLQLLARFAHAMELEVQAHRLIEASRQGRQMVEELAKAAELPFSEDNIIRPDFSKP
jgi:hypothetical protein